MTPTLDIDTLKLDSGSHSEGAGYCVMEAVAYLAGEPWSDHPKCASPTIGAFLRAWNDRLGDDDRQNLKQYIPRLVGSAGTPEQETARAWMCTDWLVRVNTPMWLRLAGLDEQADRLANLAQLEAGCMPALRPTLDAARSDCVTSRRTSQERIVEKLKAAEAAGAAWAAWAAEAAGAAWAAKAAEAAGAAGAAEAAGAAWAAGAAKAAGAAGAAEAAEAAGAAWAAEAAKAAEAAEAAGDYSRLRQMARDAVTERLAPHLPAMQASAHDLVDRMLATTEVVS